MRDWRNQAGCLDVDPEVFYPVDLDPAGPAVAAAKRVCAACPVRSACLADALAVEDPSRRWGVAAGLTPDERSELFRIQQRGAVSAEWRGLGVAV